MRTIVFLECNKSGSSREAVKAAERLGFFTVLFTNRERYLSQRTEFPDVHRMIYADLHDYEQLSSQIETLQAQGKKIAAITSYVDSHVFMASALGKKYCNQRQSVEAIFKMEDKVKTREALQDTSYCPYYTTYDGEVSVAKFVEEHNSLLPLIVKSPGSTGSKDVFLTTSPDQLQTYIAKLRAKYPDEPVLIEEYLDGPQYLVEVVVHQEQIHIVALIQQDILINGKFVVTGYSVLIDPPSDFYKSISAAVKEIVSKLGMSSGACHLEMRLINDKWKLIEINPRISGGAMNRMLEVAYGISLVEETLKLLLGQEPNLTPRHKRHVYTQYLTVPKSGFLESVHGKNRAWRIPGVAEVYIKPRRGQRLYRAESMGHRYAYVIATGMSARDARETAWEAAREITFEMQ